MSNINEAIKAMTGSGNKAQVGDNVDYKAKIAELEKQLQLERIEKGRLSKANAEIEELKKKNRELSERKLSEDLLSAVPTDDQGVVGSDILNATTKIVGHGMERVQADLGERLAALEAKQKQNAEAAHEERVREMVSTIEANYPGFFNSIGAGGDKSTAWAHYLANNQGSISQAFEAGNTATVKYHIDRFFREELSIQPPKPNQETTAVPDPKNVGGVKQTVDHQGKAKTYTAAEYAELEKSAEDFRRNGDIAKYREIVQELDNILSEGRLTQ